VIPFPATATLIVIDVQQAIDAPYWAKDGPRNNPDAEATIAALQAAWRKSGRPIIHVRHDSREPNSAYRPGQPGNAFKELVRPLPGETIVPKHTCSAFVETGLEKRLRDAGSDTIVVCGVITNNSVETTVRMAGCLGFKVSLVEDACFTFARRAGGRLFSAEDVHALSLANLEGEYAEIVTADEVLKVV
jgi:nicotinamidase-related amidase